MREREMRAWLSIVESTSRGIGGRSMSMRPNWIALTVATIVLSSLASLAAHADRHGTTRALVVGIDEYELVPRLRGAVNDARDIAAGLRKQGVGDLTLLVDREASRDAIEQSWSGLVERSSPGDTIVFSFAGHGTQEPERIAGGEADGLDEVLLLARFATEGSRTRERIVDDELNGWFHVADSKGISVIFVADACHSGTVTRAVDPRAGAVSYRYTSPYTITEDMLRITVPPALSAAGADGLANVVQLSAAQDNQIVPEIMLPTPGGVWGARGALSYAFARALEGAADGDRDGTVSRGELRDYVESQVRTLSESRQTPNVVHIGSDSRSAFPVPENASGMELPGDFLVRFSILGPAGAVGPPDVSGALVVSLEEGPDFIWDSGSAQVLNHLGDVEADGVSADDLQSVIDRVAVLRRLKLMSARSSLRMRVTPNDGAHRHGDQIGFRVDDLRHRYLTIFGITGDGTIQYLYPVSTDSPTIDDGFGFAVRFQVTPPFGADHIVAIVTPDQPEILQRALARSSGERAAYAIESALGRIFSDPAAQVGVQGLFTRP